MSKNTIQNVFEHLDTLLKKHDEIFRCHVDICDILLNETGIFALHHLPFRLGSLLKLWTTNSHWRIRKGSDTIYIYAIKMPNKYDVKIDSYGWSVKEQKIVKIQGLQYHLMFNDAVRVGIDTYPTKKPLEKLLKELK